MPINPHTTRAAGTILTAAIYNADHENHVTNAEFLEDATNIQLSPTVLGAGTVQGALEAIVDHVATPGLALGAAFNLSAVGSLTIDLTGTTGVRGVSILITGATPDTAAVDFLMRMGATAGTINTTANYNWRHVIPGATPTGQEGIGDTVIELASTIAATNAGRIAGIVHILGVPSQSTITTRIWFSMQRSTTANSYIGGAAFSGTAFNWNVLQFFFSAGDIATILGGVYLWRSI